MSKSDFGLWISACVRRLTRPGCRSTCTTTAADVANSAISADGSGGTNSIAPSRSTSLDGAEKRLVYASTAAAKFIRRMSDTRKSSGCARSRSKRRELPHPRPRHEFAPHQAPEPLRSGSLRSERHWRARCLRMYPRCARGCARKPCGLAQT